NIAHERMFDLFRMVLNGGQELPKVLREIGRMLLGNPFERGLDVPELVEHDGLKEITFARKAGVQGFLAHPQFTGQIIHGDPAKPVGKEMPARRGDDPAANLASFFDAVFPVLLSANHATALLGTRYT